MTDTGADHVLISRAGEPRRAEGRDPGGLRPGLHVLGDAAEGEPTSDEEAEARVDTELRGLHAKVYVPERDMKASVLTGSANATDAGFGGQR